MRTSAAKATVLMAATVALLGGCGTDDSPTVPPVSQAPGSPYAIPIVLPPCDASSASVRLIQSDADWDGINDPEVRVFCVAPGDYTAVGAIRLEADGTPGQERWIRYYDPANPSDTRHPVQRSPSERAVIDTLRFTAASHWIVHGLMVTGDWTVVRLDDGSEHNVLDMLLVERAAVVLRHGAHHNTVQNSVLRSAPMVPGSDRVCMVLSGSNEGAAVQIHGTRIVNNEIYDCTDSIQLYRPDESQHEIDFGDTIIDDNDLYLTSAVYSDCNGNLDPQGDCACAENAIDIKSAGNRPDNIVQVSNNRLWGFKPGDETCGGTGSSGNASTVHFTGRYTLHQGNKIWDSPGGLTLLNDHHSAVDNVFFDINRPQDDRGTAIYVEGPNCEIYRNVVVDVRDWAAVPGADGDYRCNTLIDGGGHRGQPGAGITADYNWYYNAEQLALPGDHDTVSENAADAAHTDLCFSVRRWTGPEQVCIPNGAPTGASPHAGQCDPALGQRPDVGIHDEPW